MKVCRFMVCFSVGLAIGTALLHDTFGFVMSCVALMLWIYNLEIEKRKSNEPHD